MEFEEVIAVHLGEVVLKGLNRPGFESALIANIRAQAGEACGRIAKTDSRLLIYPTDQERTLKSLAKVFGISWYSPAIICKREIEEIASLVVEKAQMLKGIGVRVEASRSDKSYRLTSPEIERHVGKALEDAGHVIRLKNPEQRIYISILKEKAVISIGRINGLGGLPAGTSGKALCLLSGGIDSPVASWLMMKRGCGVDFLHVHSGRSSQDVRSSKMMKILETLQGYYPKRCRLFVAPYHEFYKKSMSSDPKSELVLFRRFLFRLAGCVAEKEGHLGVVSGDNIGQVASQTLENLAAVQSACSLPIYRPVLTYDKQEIVDLARKIGTYEISVQEYKDCCSLVAAKHPSTRMKIELAQRLEKEIKMEEIIDKTLEQLEIIEI